MNPLRTPWSPRRRPGGRHLALALLCITVLPIQAGELWRVQTSAPVTASPLVSQQALYLANGYQLRALSLDGKPLWSRDFTGQLHSQPLRMADKLLVHADDGLHALSLEGEPLWHHASQDGPMQVEGESWGWGKGLKADPWAWYRSSIASDGKLAYYGTRQGTYAVDLADGRERWHADTGTSHTTPALAQNLLVVGSWNNHLYGLNKDTGRIVWQREGCTPGGQYKDWIGWLGFNLDPLVDDKAVYAGNRGTCFYKMDHQTGELEWQVKHATSWIGSPARAQGDKVVYGLSDGLALVEQDKATGNFTRVIQSPHLIFAPPALMGDRLFFATLSGELYRVDTHSSKPQRVFQTLASRDHYAEHVKAEGGPIYHTPPKELSAHDGATWQVNIMLKELDAIVSLSEQDGRLYLGTHDGQLIVFQPAAAP
ncbi:outer membrane protein assembly factor BamB family protein [Microbulbifer sp.]|uniref:outer membrane protein assembly factor BamB family protein n=1 Tax=Microbulbifer sp. TaxID=1908541 RepID=UPI003F413D33